MYFSLELLFLTWVRLVRVSLLGLCPEDRFIGLFFLGVWYLGRNVRNWMGYFVKSCFSIANLV